MLHPTVLSWRWRRQRQRMLGRAADDQEAFVCYAVTELSGACARARLYARLIASRCEREGRIAGHCKGRTDHAKLRRRSALPVVQAPLQRCDLVVVRARHGSRRGDPERGAEGVGSAETRKRLLPLVVLVSESFLARERSKRKSRVASHRISSRQGHIRVV